jgi:hypothetical protein
MLLSRAGSDGEFAAKKSDDHSRLRSAAHRARFEGTIRFALGGISIHDEIGVDMSGPSQLPGVQSLALPGSAEERSLIERVGPLSRRDIESAVTLRTWEARRWPPAVNPCLLAMVPWSGDWP